MYAKSAKWTLVNVQPALRNARQRAHASKCAMRCGHSQWWPVKSGARSTGMRTMKRFCARQRCGICDSRLLQHHRQLVIRASMPLHAQY